jgi:hypothetical protein
MPDRAGRFSLEDGLGIAQAFRGIRDQQQDMKERDQRMEDRALQMEDRRQIIDERRRDVQQRQKIEGYVNRSLRGEKIDTGEADYDGASHLAAQGIILRKAQDDEGYRSQKLANDQKLAEEAEKKVNEHISQAQVYYYKSKRATTPEDRQDLERRAYDALLPVYEHVPDGGKNMRFKDESRSSLVFTDANGKEQEMAAPPLEKALFQIAVPFSKEQRKIFIDTRQKIKEFNTQQMIAAATDPAMRQRTADGKEALYVVFADPDASGDYSVRQTWIDPKTGKTLKGFDPETKKEVQSGLEFRSVAYWKSVQALSGDERKSWEGAIEAAEKAWESNLKQDAIDPSAVDESQWKEDYATAYYRRLRPSAPLPQGVKSQPSGTKSAGDWRSYVPDLGAGSDQMMAAHTPTAASPQNEVGIARNESQGGIVPTAKAGTAAPAQAPAEPPGPQMVQKGNQYIIVMPDGSQRQATADEVRKWRDTGVVDWLLSGGTPQPARGAVTSRQAPAPRGY